MFSLEFYKRSQDCFFKKKIYEELLLELMNIWGSLSLPKSEKSYHELVLFSFSESEPLAYNCMINSTTVAFIRFVLSISLTAAFSVCSLFFTVSLSAEANDHIENSSYRKCTKKPI